MAAIIQFCDLRSWAMKWSLVQAISRSIGDSVIEPRMYMIAANEALILIQLLTWGVTLLVEPEYITMHPLRKIIGSVHPTMGWNYPPCSFIGLTLSSFVVYFVWRFVWNDRTATRLLVGKGPLPWWHSFEYNANVLLMLSSHLFLCIWFLGPESNGTLKAVPLETLDSPNLAAWTSHMLIWFVVYIAWYLVCFGAWLEARFSPSATVATSSFSFYVLIYGVITAYFITVYSVNLFTYEPGVPPMLPSSVTQPAPLLHLACFMAFPYMLPPGNNFKVRLRWRHADAHVRLTSFPVKHVHV